jgi:hypothetical protein
LYALALPTSAQQKPDTDDGGLMGPVRSVLVESLRPLRLPWLFSIQRRLSLRRISFDADGHKTKAVTYDPATKKSLTEVYSYDIWGRKTELIVRQRSIVAKTVYRYHEKKNEIEALEQVTSGRRSIMRKYVSIFDSDGNQIAASFSEGGGTEVKASYHYEYNDDGKLRIIETRDGGDFAYHRIVYMYDSAGKLSMTSAFGPDGGLYDRRIFSYGAHRKTEERLTYKDRTNLDRKIVYHYDDRQNLIEVAGYNASSSLLGRTTHALKYDEVGNWTEKISQSWDVHTSKPTSKWTEYREICYW